MKLNEIILAATEEDLAGCDADSILARAKQMPARRKLAGWKKVLIIAAAACLFVGTASAAVLLSGFGTAFERPIDTGRVDVLDASPDNEEVIWKFTETWYDKNIIFLGGTVTTPEPLDPAGEYMAVCGIKVPGDKIYSDFLNVYIYAVGERESAFLMYCNLLRQKSDFMTQAKNEDGSVTLELTVYEFHDLRFTPKGRPYTSDDIEVLFPGPWIYTVQLESNDEKNIRLDGRYESMWPDRSSAVVTSVKLTAFSLEINGEDLTYSYNTRDEGRKKAPLLIWLKMKDGTLLFKSKGIFANKDSDIHYRECTDASIIYLFGKPIDPTEVESMILYEAFGTTPTNPAAEEYYTKNGIVFYPSPDEIGKTETWLPLIEIPLN